jgi:hypothetical protein
VAGLVERPTYRAKEVPMRKLVIQLWRNPAERNWSVQINDKHYDRVTLMFVQQFVAQSLADVKKALMEPGARKAH